MSEIADLMFGLFFFFCLFLFPRWFWLNLRLLFCIGVFMCIYVFVFWGVDAFFDLFCFSFFRFVFSFFFVMVLFFGWTDRRLGLPELGKTGL